MKIRLGGLEQQAVKALLQAHHQDMLQHSPLESVHALDLNKLQADNITFWSAWIDDQLAGCGALKMLDSNHAEIKSMRTSQDFLRQGVAAKILQHILEVARRRNCTRVSLETGSMTAFIPAQKLYQNFGFRPCQPFADYTQDPYSLFMTLDL